MIFNTSVPTRSAGSINDQMWAHRKLTAAGFGPGGGADHPTFEHRTQKVTVSDLMSHARSLAAENPALSKEQHFARLLRANPSAYEEYLRQNPAQTGR